MSESKRLSKERLSEIELWIRPRAYADVESFIELLQHIEAVEAELDKVRGERDSLKSEKEYLKAQYEAVVKENGKLWIENDTLSTQNQIYERGIEQYLEDNDDDCGCGGEDGAEDYKGSTCALHEALTKAQGMKGGEDE